MEHITDMPYCWCEPRQEVVNGIIITVHRCDTCRTDPCVCVAPEGVSVEYYIYYVKHQSSDGKEFEDLSWYSEGDNELFDAVRIFNDQSQRHHMRLYAIYRPQNRKVLLREKKPN